MAQTPPADAATSPWAALRRHTPARIGLGHAGTSLPTSAHLAFQLAHARARKAVHHALDAEALAAALRELGHETVSLHSAAGDRAKYLQRPDAGRRLDEHSREALCALASGMDFDLALVVGDGLSALAIEENAVPFVEALQPRLAGWRVAPIAVVRQARVAVGDEIGAILRARMVVMLIGERPGLSSPDSMGLYLTMAPEPGRTDEARNCISNVRPDGLSAERAAAKLFYLVTQAFERGYSGVRLKDEEAAEPTLSPGGAGNFLTR